MLFEAELVINLPLTYVYPNTCKTCLTAIDLLFGRQLSHSPNTTWSHFGDSWRQEYAVNISEIQRRSKLNINSLKIDVNDIVPVYDEKVPKHFWRIAIVAGVLPSRYSEIRGAIVKSAKTNTILKRSINKFFTIENTYHDTDQTDKTKEQKLRQDQSYFVN